MKKLLLLSLLALGATSFAAVEGEQDRAEMPITVKGSVIDPTDGNLIIEPKGDGLNGSAMEFDFGGVKKGGTYSSKGGFAVYRSNNEAIAEGKTITIGILTADGKAIDPNPISAVGTDGKVDLAYAVGYGVSGDSKRIDGTVAVTAKVATNAAAGSFLDASKRLAVIVK